MSDLTNWADACAAAGFPKKRAKGSRRDPGHLYADALEKHKQMEAELSRALNRWQKSRAALHRIEKKLDAFNPHHEE